MSLYGSKYAALSVMMQSHDLTSVEAVALISKLTQILAWHCARLIASGRQLSLLLIVYKLIFNTRAMSGSTASSFK